MDSEIKSNQIKGKSNIALAVKQKEKKGQHFCLPD
jgi:hypothetical protein